MLQKSWHQQYDVVIVKVPTDVLTDPSYRMISEDMDMALSSLSLSPAKQTTSIFSLLLLIVVPILMHVEKGCTQVPYKTSSYTRAAAAAAAAGTRVTAAIVVPQIVIRMGTLVAAARQSITTEGSIPPVSSKHIDKATTTLTTTIMETTNIITRYCSD